MTLVLLVVWNHPVRAQNAGFFVYPPGEVVAGKSEGEWMVEWWRWYYETPRAENPNQNHLSTCGPQPDTEVFMLTNTIFPSGRNERTIFCDVPHGKPIFLLLVGTISASPWGAGDCAGNRQRTVWWWEDRLALGATVEVEVDGIQIENLLDRLTGHEECASFDLPPDALNPFGAQQWSNFATRGLALLLDLEGGEHLIRTRVIITNPGQGFVDFTQTYEIDVLEAEVNFRRGDCNGDGEVNLTDAVCALDWLFGGAGAKCRAALNTNGDDTVNITDPVSLLNHLFAGGPAPVAPFPDCGPGALPADSELGCANPPDCP